MTIQYTWDVKDLQTKTIDGKDVVTAIFWEVTGDDGTKTFFLDKWQTLDYNQENEFINYPNITKEVVLGWLRESMGERWEHFERLIDANFVRMANEQTKLDLPWGN